MLNSDNKKEPKKESTIDALKKHIQFFYSFKGRLNRKFFILLILESLGIWFIKGTNGENKYGPDLLQVKE